MQISVALNARCSRQLRLWDAEKGEPLRGRAGEGEQAQTATPRMQQSLTTHLCPRNFLSSCPVSTLHIRTLQSPPSTTCGFPLQEATSEPSAEKLTPLTCELYFGCKLVTTLTTLCNGRLRLCRFLEGSGNTFVILVYASPPVSGGKRERHAVLNNAKYATFRKKQSPVALERLQALAC